MFEYAKYGRYWKCVDFGNYYLLEFVIINDNSLLLNASKFLSKFHKIYFSIDNNNLYV